DPGDRHPGEDGDDRADGEDVIRFTDPVRRAEESQDAAGEGDRQQGVPEVDQQPRNQGFSDDVHRVVRDVPGEAAWAAERRGEDVAQQLERLAHLAQGCSERPVDQQVVPGRSGGLSALVFLDRHSITLRSAVVGAAAVVAGASLTWPCYSRLRSSPGNFPGTRQCWLSHLLWRATDASASDNQRTRELGRHAYPFTTNQ